MTLQKISEGIKSPHDDTYLLAQTVDGSRDWLWEVDTSWRFISPSRRRAELLGIGVDDLIGQSVFDLMPLADVGRLRKIFSKLKSKPRIFSALACRYTRSNGALLVLETTGVPLFDEHQRFYGYRGIDRDVTSTGLLSLDGRSVKLETIYETLPIALCIVGRDGRLLSVNNVHAELANRPVESLIGMRVADLNEQGGKNVERDFRVFDAGGTVPAHELPIGNRIYQVSVSPVRNAAGKVNAISVAHLDITERKRLERQLAEANQRLGQLATRDHLTGLFNRRHFDTVMSEMLEGYRSEGPLSVVLFDIDYFKRYNDRYGHIAGDRSLLCVAQAAANAIDADHAVLCRYGGEEFVALLPDADRQCATQTAEQIRKAVASLGIEHADSPFGTVTVSVGVATLDLGRTIGRADGDAILRAADASLYLAKLGGRNLVRFAI
jgi:diguanylate cyclase (GGDEF)-like protein/PAS domain S-box-containing protein